MKDERGDETQEERRRRWQEKMDAWNQGKPITAQEIRDGKKEGKDEDHPGK